MNFLIEVFQRRNSKLENSTEHLADSPALKISLRDKDQRWKILEKGEKPGKMQNIGYTKSYLIGLQKYFFEPLHLMFLDWTSFGTILMVNLGSLKYRYNIPLNMYTLILIYKLW